MNTTWILIVLWFPASSQSGKQIEFQEWTTEKRCNDAAMEIMKVAPGDLMRAWCKPK